MRYIQDSCAVIFMSLLYKQSGSILIVTFNIHGRFIFEPMFLNNSSVLLLNIL
jgi:hypothetical protein